MAKTGVSPAAHSGLSPTAAAQVRRLAESVTRYGCSCYLHTPTAVNALKGTAQAIREAFELGAFQDGPYARIGDNIRAAIVENDRTIVVDGGIEVPMWVPLLWFAVLDVVARINPKLFLSPDVHCGDPDEVTERMAKPYLERWSVVAEESRREPRYMPAVMPSQRSPALYREQKYPVIIRPEYSDFHTIARVLTEEADRIEAEVAVNKTAAVAAQAKNREMMLLTKAQNIFGFKSPKALTCFLDRHPNVGQDKPLTKAGKPNKRRRQIDVLALCEAISRDDAIMSDPARRAKMEARLKKAELNKKLEESAMAFIHG